MAKHHPVRTSTILKNIAQSERKNPTIGDLVKLLGDRSFALAMLIFALPNSIPMPGIPGFSTITGIPIILFALQMIRGRPSIWLPKKIAEKHFSHDLLVKIITKSLPVVLWVEKLLKPRLSILCESWGERLLGVIILIHAIILSLPIPGGNFPMGFSISLLTLAILEKDGLLAIIGVAISLGCFVLMYKVIALAITGLMDLISG